MKLIHMAQATWISLVVGTLLLAGCSTSSPLQKMNSDSPGTAELMRQAPFAPGGSGAAEPVRPMFDYNYTDYTRTAQHELDVLFPRLPNPTLVMYVYPHISAAGVPVPGYSTAFTMFNQPHYALPGEMPASFHKE
ncbi:MAG: TIGR03751 family conjugal transfer lipoprotein [Methyloprofundus sp.]|nr:TIGR03751 family conjugal transfer lipoprotein [Methyloprofundus sp.]